ncbi:hypothetical protein CHUAL_004607 [Chamberlinius hualienensis]
METENSMESDGTCPREVSSWQSEETPDDDLLSLSPSSCPTPTPPENDTVDQLNFSVGVTESTPYACQFCDKAFPRLSYLKRHEQSHGDQMPFKCGFCHRLFKHKRSRDRHIKLHTGDKKYRCPHCEAAFSRSDHLKIHMKTHDNAKPFQCTICNRGYNTAAALTSHMQNHKKNMLNNSFAFSCMLCAAAFANLKQLQEHTASAHVCNAITPPLKQEPTSAIPLPLASDEQKDDTIKTEIYPERLSSVENHYSHYKIQDVFDEESTNARLMCTHCSKDNFQNAESLQHHLKSHHGIFNNGDLAHSSNHVGHRSSSSSSSASNCSRSPQYSPAANSSSSKRHFKSFSSRNRQQQPLALSDSVSLNCDYCTMKFSSTQTLQKHTLTVHSFSEIVASSNASETCQDFVCCQHCTMAFSSATLLSEHVQCVHSHVSANDAKRNINGKHGTGKVTNNMNNNNNGNVTIKTEKVNGHSLNSLQQATTFLCSQCNAAFPDFEAFRAHLKTHLDEAVVQKFICSECQVEFSSEEQLDGHVVGHFLSTTTEYGCQSCLKLFSKPDELQKHLMDIHAHHLYRCALCKDVFDSKVSIQVHFAVKHSNECKLFKCSACSSVFRSEMEFQLHVKVTHLRKVQPFRCLFCHFSYNSELELQCHLTTHKKQFACALCDEAFHVEFLLDRHMQSKHASTSTTSSSSSPVSTSTGAVTSTSSTTAQINDASVTVKVKSKVTPAPVTPTATCNSTTSVIVCTSSATSPTTTSQVPNKKDLRCDICDLDFGSDATLNAHRRQAHNIRVTGSGKSGQQQILSLYCAYCNEACKSRTDLENHMKVHTASCGKHKCNICDEVCPTATTLAEHKLTHCKVVTGSMCVTCKVNLKSEDQYYSHLQQHNSQGLPLPCVVCRQTLMSEIEVQMHVKFHLKNAEPLYSCCVCRKQLEMINLIGQTGGLYVCKECFHRNSPQLRITGHLTQTDVENVIDNQLESNEQLRCMECAVKFETLSDLEKHKRSVHKKTYQCIKCQMSFENESEIQLHVTSHMLHEGTDHECRLCSRVFDSPAKLQCHLIEHTFEGCSSFSCYMCSAIFTNASLLQQHMLEHGFDSRPYDCSHCHQRFFFRAELENHLFSHGVYEMLGSCTVDSACDTEGPPNKRSKINPGSDAKRNVKRAYGCGDFGKDAQNGTIRNISHKSHSPVNFNSSSHKHVCPECNKEFSLARNLGIHMKSHGITNDFVPAENSKNVATKLKQRSVKSKKENRRKVHALQSKSTNVTSDSVNSSTASAQVVSNSLLSHCESCGKSLQSSKKSNFISSDNSGNHYCESCQDKILRQSSVEEIRSSKTSASYEFACKLCFEVFDKLRNLRRHLKNVHDVDVQLDIELQNSDVSDASNNSSGSGSSVCSNYTESETFSIRSPSPTKPANENELSANNSER